MADQFLQEPLFGLGTDIIGEAFSEKVSGDAGGVRIKIILIGRENLSAALGMDDIAQEAAVIFFFGQLEVIG